MRMNIVNKIYAFFFLLKKEIRLIFFIIVNENEGQFMLIKKFRSRMMADMDTEIIKPLSWLGYLNVCSMTHVL